ncbi:MAG TPA: TetR family transcriptional regulator [Caldithrix abyssi]|uniref:TetR family transcriptional regulator n=1 Tax=Caldithrix abyssi TaxID=187145 RepID=A0A7V5PNJ9_CALAY|nr:TetR family transcriptional regulator [Caldithrix abyssi]
MTAFTNRQKDIINAAIELISEKSIQELTIKNLAQKIGLTEGALYRHFPSKVDILLSILLMFQDEARRNLEEVKSSPLSALQQFENIFLYRLRYFTKKPAVAAVIFSESIFQNDKRLSSEVNKFLKMHEATLRIILEKGIADKEIREDISVEEAIYIIIGSMRYLVTRWRLDGHRFDLYAAGQRILGTLKELLRC